MGAALTVTRPDYTAEELRSIAAKTKDGDTVRRLLAIALIFEGCSRAAAAEQNGMDRQTLRDWVHRYNAEGVDGLKSRRSPGREPRLTEAQMAELREVVVKGPDPAKHGVVRWRCVDLQQEIARRFQVEVHESTVGKWLRRLKTYGPPRCKQLIDLNWPVCVNVSGLRRVPRPRWRSARFGPHKSSGVKRRHFLKQDSETPVDCQAISISPPANSSS